MKKKLIEVALPLDDINRAAAREKSIRHGHPSTLHLWWSRKPLAAARAVLFASLVDDPSSNPDLSESEQDAERERLFGIIRRLVLWENSNDPEVLAEARTEILKSTDGHPPPVLDPFCGGGSIPLEAQRLGLEAHASDLNPVAVLITKALIEIPPKFAGNPPVNPTDRTRIGSGSSWPGATGLAADVRFYGQWMRDEAEKRIGHLYPKATLPRELGGGEATVIAWLWARTVRCPNPACGAQMPLASKWWLSTKKGKEAWVEPVIDQATKTVTFEVRSGKGAPEGTVNRQGGRCVVCDAAVEFNHIRSEGREGRMDSRLMAVVAEGQRGRVYLSPDDQSENLARSARPTWKPDTVLPKNPRDFKTPLYGMTTFGDLFTPRQLVALTTFSDLVGEARQRVLTDAVAAGLPDDGVSLEQGGTGAAAYADAVAVYLAFAVDRLADRSSTICSWDTGYVKIRNTFARQAIPMTWDFAEGNPLSDSTGNFESATEWVWKVVELSPVKTSSRVSQTDATKLAVAIPSVVSTDPPYYDNIGYADLSDYFYVWLRRSLFDTMPGLFATRLTPKSDELIASPYRHDGSKQKAQQFFESGLGATFAHLRSMQHADYPMTVYYAFKQSEAEEDSRSNGAMASTGWETMLEGLLRTGLEITATWPMRTELGNRMLGRGTNALASSIVIACRPRHIDAPLATRRDFVNALRKELPDALIRLQHGNIAPVDLAQASIGPGMAIFSRYGKVLEADGSPVRVRTALQLINQELDAYLETQEGELDPDSRFCVAWFEQYGHRDAPFGQAETLFKAKGTSLEGLVRAGVVTSGGGKVRLLRREELNPDWDPRTDKRPTTWEATQHLIRILNAEGTEGAARLMQVLGPGLSENARALAYRLYAICDRKKWAEEALAYNSLIVELSEIQEKVAQLPAAYQQQQLV